MYGFFQDDLGNKSMSRLILFGAFIVTSGIALWLHTEGSLDAMLTAWVANYGIAKTNETFRSNKGQDNG